VIILGFESGEEKEEEKKKRFKLRNHDNSIIELPFLYATASSCCLVMTLLRGLFHNYCHCRPICVTRSCQLTVFGVVDGRPIEDLRPIDTMWRPEQNRMTRSQD